MKRCVAISMFALLAASGVAHGTSIDAESLTQYRIEIRRVGAEGSILLGEGFFRFDQAVVDRLIEEGRQTDEPFEVAFPVIAAEFEMFGQVFRDEEIRWVEFYDYFGELYGLFVEMGSPICCPSCGPGGAADPCIFFSAGDFQNTLHFLVNGNDETDCEESGCYYEFIWLEEPVPAPEPGTLALLGLGLLVLGLTRRRRSEMSRP